MKTIRRRLPRLLAEELEGAEWSIVRGHGHNKLIVNGRLAGVLPANLTEHDQRAIFNTRTNIRKIIKGDQR